MTVKKKILLSTATLMAAISLGAGLISNSVLADEGTLSELTYKSEYSLNEVLTIESATIAYEGKNYETTAILYYPDGTTCALDKAALTQQGNTLWNIKRRQATA